MIWAAAIRYWCLGAILARLTGIGVQAARIDHAKRELSEYRTRVAQQSLIAEQAARAREAQNQPLIDGVAEHARNERKNLEADVVRLASVADGLRDELDSAKRRARANPGAPI